MNRVPLLLIGALGLGAAAIAGPESDAPILLPPLIVSDSRWTKPWRYVSAAGIEVLSQCDDGATRALVERTDQLNQLLGYILPPELEFHPAGPRLTILVSAAMAPSLSQTLVTRFGAGPVSRPPVRIGGSPLPLRLPGRVNMMRNLQLDDVDLMAVFAVVDERSFQSEGIGYTRDYILQLLQRRTPPLPAWFVAGFMTLSHQLSFGPGEIHLGPAPWGRFDERQALINDPDTPRRLMPMYDFFAYRPRPGVSTERVRWENQAALFVRWALDPAEPGRRAALARFVAAAADNGASEALFFQCFNLGYADARDRLSDYLPYAVSQPLVVRPPKLTPPPRVRLRDATPTEVARIKGEWERLEVQFVEAHHPEYAPQYLALARQTLTRGLDAAPHDAGVLAARGLLESDRGDPTAARPFLEAAAAAGPVRPRVYMELAKFRLADALALPDHEPLGVGVAEAVLEPLQRATTLHPRLPELFTISAEVWARSNARLTPTQWAFLQEGMRRYPASPWLLAYAAVLKADAGDFDTALAWLDRAIALSGTPALADSFRTLRTEITGAREHAAVEKAAPTPRVR